MKLLMCTSVLKIKCIFYVVVADKLSYPVELDQDLPVLFDLLDPDKSHKCYAAVTRGQAKKSL